MSILLNDFQKISAPQDRLSDSYLRDSLKYWKDCYDKILHDDDFNLEDLENIERKLNFILTRIAKYKLNLKVEYFDGELFNSVVFDKTTQKTYDIVFSLGKDPIEELCRDFGSYFENF